MILTKGNLYSFSTVDGYCTGIFEEADAALRLIRFRKVTKMMTYKPEVEWQKVFEEKHVPSYELEDAQKKVRKEIIEPLMAAGSEADIPDTFIVWDDVVLNMDHIDEIRPMKNYFQFQ